MTVPVVAMIIIGIIIIIVSFFVSEKFAKKEESINMDLLTVDDDYEFSERELQIIKRKIEDVITKQAKDILYETNESLSSMANEKTMALGDYAVAVCDEIEKNHKEVMFLYSMLDDKQKEIMNTVKAVDEANRNVKETIMEVSILEAKTEPLRKPSAIGQLTALSQIKREGKNQDADVLEHAGSEETDLEMDIADTSGQQVETVTEQDVEETDADLDIEDILAEMDQSYTYVEEEEIEEEEEQSSNDTILELYRNGESIISIAKQLGLGVGEVKLVIDLYQGD